MSGEHMDQFLSDAQAPSGEYKAKKRGRMPKLFGRKKANNATNEVAPNRYVSDVESDNEALAGGMTSPFSLIDEKPPAGFYDIEGGRSKLKNLLSRTGTKTGISSRVKKEDKVQETGGNLYGKAAKSQKKGRSHSPGQRMAEQEYDETYNDYGRGRRYSNGGGPRQGQRYGGGYDSDEDSDGYGKAPRQGRSKGRAAGGGRDRSYSDESDLGRRGRGPRGGAAGKGRGYDDVNNDEEFEGAMSGRNKAGKRKGKAGGRGGRDSDDFDEDNDAYGKGGRKGKAGRGGAGGRGSADSDDGYNNRGKGGLFNRGKNGKGGAHPEDEYNSDLDGYGKNDPRKYDRNRGSVSSNGGMDDLPRDVAKIKKGKGGRDDLDYSPRKPHAKAPKDAYARASNKKYDQTSAGRPNYDDSNVDKLPRDHYAPKRGSQSGPQDTDYRIDSPHARFDNDHGKAPGQKNNEATNGGRRPPIGFIEEGGNKHYKHKNRRGTRFGTGRRNKDEDFDIGTAPKGFYDGVDSKGKNMRARARRDSDNSRNGIGKAPAGFYGAQQYDNPRNNGEAGRWDNDGYRGDIGKAPKGFYGLGKRLFGGNKNDRYRRSGDDTDPTLGMVPRGFYDDENMHHRARRDPTNGGRRGPGEGGGGFLGMFGRAKKDGIGSAPSGTYDYRAIPEESGNFFYRANQSPQSSDPGFVGSDAPEGTYKKSAVLREPGMQIGTKCCRTTILEITVMTLVYFTTVVLLGIDFAWPRCAFEQEGWDTLELDVPITPLTDVPQYGSLAEVEALDCDVREVRLRDDLWEPRYVCVSYTTYCNQDNVPAAFDYAFVSLFVWPLWFTNLVLQALFARKVFREHRKPGEERQQRLREERVGNNAKEIRARGGSWDDKLRKFKDAKDKAKNAWQSKRAFHSWNLRSQLLNAKYSAKQKDQFGARRSCCCINAKWRRALFMYGQSALIFVISTFICIPLMPERIGDYDSFSNIVYLILVLFGPVSLEFIFVGVSAVFLRWPKKEVPGYYKPHEVVPALERKQSSHSEIVSLSDDDKDDDDDDDSEVALDVDSDDDSSVVRRGSMVLATPQEEVQLGNLDRDTGVDVANAKRVLTEERLAILEKAVFGADDEVSKQAQEKEENIVRVFIWFKKLNERLSRLEAEIFDGKLNDEAKVETRFEELEEAVFGSSPNPKAAINRKGGKRWDYGRGDADKHLTDNICLVITCHESCYTEEAVAAFEKTLRAALQIYPPEAIFICDNGNSAAPVDNTEEVCKKISEEFYEDYTVNYIYIPEGNKTHAQYWVSEVWIPLLVKNGIVPNFEFCMIIDDDVPLPADLAVQEAVDMMVLKPYVHACGFAISAVSENGEYNRLVNCQDLEYKFSGLAKLVMDRYGTVNFCHGAIGIWRRSILGKRVLYHHNTVFYGDDMYMGILLHEMGKNYKIAFRANSLVPTYAPPDLLTLFCQRVKSWDKAAHRKFLYFLRWFLFRWTYGWRKLILKFFILYEILLEIRDYQIIYLLAGSVHRDPASFSWVFFQVLYLFIIIFVFTYIVLKDRPDLRPSIDTAILFMFYKVFLAIARLIALLENIVRYAPWSKNKFRIDYRKKEFGDLPPAPVVKEKGGKVDWKTVWQRKESIKRRGSLDSE